MGLEAAIAVVGVVVSIWTYYAGVRRGERQERARQEHERELELLRQQHERELEKEHQERELASKVADEYVDMVRRRFDTGISALGRLGLERLGSDQLIRDAIHEMKVRSDVDPLSGQERHLEGIDLARFFRFVRENRVNFSRQSVESVVAEVRNLQDGGTQDAA